MAESRLVAPAPLTPQSIFDQAFSGPRDPRSVAYREGCLAALRFRLGEAEHVECPYQPGTAEFDAFHAGLDEGHALARAALTEGVEK